LIIGDVVEANVRVRSELVVTYGVLQLLITYLLITWSTNLNKVGKLLWAWFCWPIKLDNRIDEPVGGKWVVAYGLWDE